MVQINTKKNFFSKSLCCDRQLRNIKLSLGSTQVLGDQHAAYESILFVQTEIQKYLPIHVNNPLIATVSSMGDALWAGTHIGSGVQGDSIFLDILIMLPFCDAILIKLKISNDKNHYICHQL